MATQSALTTWPNTLSLASEPVEAPGEETGCAAAVDHQARVAGEALALEADADARAVEADVGRQRLDRRRVGERRAELLFQVGVPGTQHVLQIVLLTQEEAIPVVQIDQLESNLVVSTAVRKGAGVASVRGAGPRSRSVGRGDRDAAFVWLSNCA